jgi:hypothetical protein
VVVPGGLPVGSRPDGGCSWVGHPQSVARPVTG